MGTKYAKAPLEPLKFIRNGRYPDATFAAELADHTNQAALYRGKNHFSYAYPMLSIPAGTGENGTIDRWRFPFMASPYLTVVRAVAWLAPVATTLSGSAGVRVRIETGRGPGETPATVGDAQVDFGATVSAPGDVPDYFARMPVYVSTPTMIAAMPSNTWLYGTVAVVNDGRIAAISVHEDPLVSSPIVDDGIAATSPIYDKDREDVVVASRLMWKRGAGPLFTWQGPRTRSSATAVNAIDDSSTSPSVSTPYFAPNLQYKTTVRRGTVPCMFFVFGSAPSGSGGTVTLRDASNTTLATINGITTVGWYSTTVNLPATDGEKYYLFYSGDGTVTFYLEATALLQWATGS